MAKRSRGTTARPGQRRPTPRPAARPIAPRAQTVQPVRPDTLSQDEEARAAELEAQIVAEERAAELNRSRGRDARRAAAAAGVDPARGRMREVGIAARAAEEYTYVARDVRRIVRVGGSMVGIMAVLFILIEVFHVVTF